MNNEVEESREEKKKNFVIGSLFFLYCANKKDFFVMLCVTLHLLVPQQSGGPLEATLIILDNKQLFITQTSSR